MFRKKREKYNLYLDEIDYMDSEDDLLDEELLDEELLEEDMARALPEDPEQTDEDDIDLSLEDLDAFDDEDISSAAIAEEILEKEDSGEQPAADLPEEDTGLPDDGQSSGISDGPASNRDKKTGGKGLFKKKKKENKPPKKKKTGKTKKKKKDDNILPGSGLEEPEKRLSPRKIAAIAAAATIVLGAAVFFIIHNLDSGDDSKVYVESVGELTGLGSANGMNNRYTGMVEAQDSWKISLQSDMSVAKCYVSVGDEVKKGDKLFSYNTEELKLNKEKKELEVEQQTNEINQLTKDIAEYQNDLKNAGASEKIELQTQILTAQTTIKKDEFTIKSSKEEIKTLEKNIKDATVKSKMAGLVKSINTSLGEGNGNENEQSYGDSSDDTTYMTILALGDYRIRGKVSETNVWALNEGDPVIVRSRLDDSVTWRGSISKIKTDTNADSETNAASEIDYDTGDSSKESASDYYFYVTLEQDDGLMLGQHVLIEIDNGQDEERSGMWLNSAYLHIDGDNYYVWAANSRDRLTLRKVKVGNYDEELDEYEITDGLSITDYIASEAENLHENMKTTKVDSEADGEDEYLDGESNDDNMYNDGPENIDETGLDDDADYEDGLGADKLDGSVDADEELNGLDENIN